MTRRDNKEKFVAVFLALTFVMTSFFYVAQPMRGFAQIPDFITTPVAPGVPLAGFSTPIPKPTLVVGDLWGSFLQGVIKAGESAGYTILRKYMRKALQNLTKDVWKKLLTGGKGQAEVFQTEPWKDFWDEAGNEAVGSAIEGFAQGFQNEYEFSKQKNANLQQLNENYGKLNEEDKKKEVDALARTAPSTPVETTFLDTWNTVKPDGISTCADQAKHGALSAACLEMQTRPGATALEILGTDDRDALKTWDEMGCNQTISDACRIFQESPSAQSALSKKSSVRNRLQADYEIDKKKLEASHDDQNKAAQLKANKADADLIAGNVGALSEASRTLIDVVCKPEPDIAFKIFLGLADQIELKKRKAICPLDTLTKNWQEVVSNTGAKLDEASLQGWNALAGLVDPDTSDLGVQWKLSVAGHSIKDIAQSLGVTDFGAIASQGGIKDITDFSGKTTTPAGVVRSLAENSLKVQIEEDTRFIPTGHLLADLILTAGSTVLSTSLDILKEGLRKKQAVARKGVTGEAFAQLTKGNDVLYHPSFNPDFGGVEAAEARLADFSRLDLSPPQDWNVLAKLTSESCPDGMPGGAKGGDIDACVMDDKFAEAVKERITVKEALARGLLNKDGAFGFDIQSSSNPRTLSWQRNFPYRSLVIMRKYRVLPVSWELAALYIQKHPGEFDNKNLTLPDLIARSKNSSTPFYGMIDENWVLKIPPVLCALKGYGPEYQTSTPSQDCDKNDPTKCKTVTQVNRAPEQCVDYQTCLDEDAEGKCKDNRYGYCLQEQKIIRFKGETCDEQYNGCESFQDMQTKSTAGYLKQSLQNNTFDLATGKCTARNAGCQWYSATRGIALAGSPSRVDLGSDMKAKVSATPGWTAIQQEWFSAPSDKAYFASSVQKCDAGADGCRAINGPAGTPEYLRLPPPSLKCLTDGIKDGAVVPWYKREDCKEYTQLCTRDYNGCQQYMPQGDTIAVTGKVFGGPGDINQNRCPFACANINSYAEGKTLFDESVTDRSRGSTYFSAATAQRCSLADAGCEEFTNLDAVARGGEGKEQYTYLQRCERGDPETIPANEVFYSFVGSDTAGGQPEKYYLKGDGTPGADEYKPACADNRPCDCSAANAERQKFDPRIGTILCREFINSKGKPFYRYTDNLVYRTADCTSYRRTLDGATGLASTYSPRYSRACLASATNCREYRAPQAGNTRIISYDNFEGGNNTSWKNWDDSPRLPGYVASSFSKATLTLSNEGEVLGDHSMKIETTPVVPTTTASQQSVYIEKTISLSKGKNYSIEFNAKRTESVSPGDPHDIGISFFGFQGGGEAAFLGYQDLNEKDQWKHFKYTMTLAQSVLEGEGKMLIIFQRPLTGDQVFYLDDIRMKEASGIEYLIRDSWNQNGSCFKPISTADPTPDFNNPAYPNCSLYTDKKGTQNALMSFQRVCPNEMAGCVQVTVKEGMIVTDPSDNTKKILVDSDPLYIIPDESKACRAEDNKCTAYGSPKLLASLSSADPSPIKRSKVDKTTYKEEWNIGYFKVTPLETFIGKEKLLANNPEPYAQGICQQTDIGCREYATGSKGGSAYFRDPGARVCQPPEGGDAGWFYHTCQTTPSIICQQDSDCPVAGDIQEKCNTNKKEWCHLYREWGQAAEPTSLVKCPCDKDSDKLDCDNAVRLSTDPSECKDVFDKGRYSHKMINDDHIPSNSFALACPASVAGCRKISDPECSASTKTLRNDYGRGTVGIPCTPAYYFTEDLDTRTKECDGKVNVEEGCLLLDDEGKATYEYMKDTGTGSVVGVNTAPNPPQCRCDINPETKDCTDAFPATEHDPEYCYDRYSIASGAELQRYKRNRTDKKYDSTNYYASSKINGSVNIGETFSGLSTYGKDANVLMKVKQDRQCKTWLKCTGFWKEGEREICFKRDLCDKWGVGNSCESGGTVGLATFPGINGLVTTSTSSTTISGSIFGSGASIPNPTATLASLSGVARPDYEFPHSGTPSWKTGGGYGFNFNKWQQAPETDVGNRSYSRLDLTGNTAVRDKAAITNSCRLYPQQTTGITTPSNIVDACRVEAGSYGIYGYCLEPYPNYKADYYGGNNYYRHVCTNNYSKDCTNDGECPDGKCGLRYYENACLTWMPVDRIEGQRNLFTSQTGQEMSMYNATEPNVYYCLSTTSEPVDWPTSLTYRPASTPRPTINARDTRLEPTKKFERNYNRTHTILWAPRTNTGFTNPNGTEWNFDYRNGNNSDTTFDDTHLFLAYDIDVHDRSDIATYGSIFREPNRYRRVLPNEIETFKKEDVASVDYFINAELFEFYYGFGSSCSIFGCAWNYGEGKVSDTEPNKYYQPNGSKIGADFGSDEPFVWSLSKPSLNLGELSPADKEVIKDRFKQSFTAGSCPSEADIRDGESILVIKPSFEEDSNSPNYHHFLGWDYVVCRKRGVLDEATNAYSIFAAALSMDVKQTNQTYPANTLTYSYENTFCKDYATVVKNGEAVPNKLIDNFVPEREGSVRLPEDLTKPVIYKRRPIGWGNGSTTGCNPTIAAEVQSGEIVESPAGLDTAHFSCSTPLGQSDFYFDAFTNPPSGEAKKKVLGSIDNIRSQTPFAKAYEYWNWNGSTYINEDYWGMTPGGFRDPTTGLANFWSATKMIGRRSTNVPRIYGTTSAEQDKFAVKTFDNNKIEVRFYAKVKDTQRPIKYLAIDWGDGNVLSVAKSTFDGRGTAEKPPRANEEPIDTFSGYGPFHYEYNDDPSTLLVDESLRAGKSVTVIIRDNWDVTTLTRGTFAEDGTTINFSRMSF